MKTKTLALSSGCLTAVLAICAAAAYVGLAKPLPATESPDEVKAAIVRDYSESPLEFQFEAASDRLAASRLDGEFGVCASNAEATPDQYVELSGMVDHYSSKEPGVRLALHRALQNEGVSDCDYRVMMTILHALARAESAGPDHTGPAESITAPRT